MNSPATIAHLDCSTGVSGDKFLGALLDAGSHGGRFTEEHLRDLLGGLTPEASVNVSRVRSHGVSALGVSVEATEQPSHRHWSDIRQLLQRAEMPDAARSCALRVFERLAKAEAAAHGCRADDVHFHEVGALDSILDIAGTCLGMYLLGIEDLRASEVATGWGTIETSHGVLPVPAPATAALLVNVPVVAGFPRPDGTAPGELTTPTGAALLAVLASGFGPCPPMTPRTIGYGAGTRDIGIPNVCRITLGEATARAPHVRNEPIALLETNVDHLSPEALAVAADQLLAEGALDVWTSPIVMKKGRSAVTLSVLTGDAKHFAGRIVALTGTLGVRRTELDRFTAKREVRRIETPYGTVRVKIGPAGVANRYRPEADDVARIARETFSAFHTVAAELEELAREQLGG